MQKINLILDKLRYFIGWFFGAVFLAIGIGSFFSFLTGGGNRLIDYLISLMFYAAAAMCLPPATKFTQEKFNFAPKLIVRFVAIFFIVIVAANLSNVSRNSSLQASKQVVTPPASPQELVTPAKTLVPEEPKTLPSKQAVAPKPIPQAKTTPKQAVVPKATPQVKTPPKQTELRSEPKLVPPPDDSIAFGSPAQVDDFGFKVFNVNSSKELAWTEFGNKVNFSGKLVVVELGVVNLGNKTAALGFRKFILVDDKGLEYEKLSAFDALSVSRHMGGVGLSDQIRPQAVVTSYLVFDVNPDSKPAFLTTGGGFLKGDLKFRLN